MGDFHALEPRGGHARRRRIYAPETLGLHRPPGDRCSHQATSRAAAGGRSGHHAACRRTGRTRRAALSHHLIDLDAKSLPAYHPSFAERGARSERMNWTTRRRWIPPYLLLMIALWPCPVLAQPAPAPNNTILPPPSGDEPPPTPAPGPALVIPNTGPFAPPPAPPPPAAENLWGLIPDWSCMPRVFFADKEIDNAKPHLKAALIGPAIFPGGVTTSVHPPTATLNWVGIPRIEIGWFLPPSL